MPMKLRRVHNNHKKKRMELFVSLPPRIISIGSIERPLSKNMIIGVIYRPSDSNVNNFVQNFNSLLAKIGKENKLSICWVILIWF